MRITFLQLILASVFLSISYANTAKSQEILDREVTATWEHVSLKTVLKSISSQLDVKFIFSNKIINVDRKITLEVTNQKLSSVLSSLLNTKEISIDVIEDQIVLSRKHAIAPSTIIPEVESEYGPTISGLVTDEGNEPVVGVNVIEKGTTNGTVTDVNGSFTLTLVNDNATLIFSFIGYTTQEVAAGNQSNITVKLQPDIQTLGEVVVVGYGTVKKSDVTGSVSSVKSEQLTAFPALSAQQALQGRAAGVNIQANNGDPGGSFKVRIRGGTSINASSNPLYVVDGFVGAVIPPPEDIESMEILKDASATAIYGSRGANGVIIITTKKGKSGKAKIEFNASFTSQDEINRIEMLNAEEFIEYTQEAIPAYVPGTANTDWQDEIFQKGGIKNYQLSVSGGTDNVNYYVSGAYYDQKGIIRASAYDRLSLTSNVNFKVNEKLSSGVNLFVRRTNRLGLRTQETSAGANDAGVVGSALRFMPDLPVRKPDGSFSIATIGDPIDNPYAVATQRENENINDLMQGNLYVNYDFFNWLSFRTTIGVNTTNSRTGEFTPTTLNAGRNVGGDATIRASKDMNVINENYVTFHKKIASVHDVTAMAGYSYQRNVNTDWSARGQSFITNNVSFWNLNGAAVLQAPSSSIQESQIGSYYSRLNYSFKEKYLLTFNARYDGSSNFSKNHKWAFFPSGALAWNMKNEAFMDNTEFVSLLKWRVSYGLTGNQAISPYQTLARFSNVLTVVNGLRANAVRPTQVANDDLTWETTAQLDIGVDAGFFDDRVNLTVDYYRMVTSDLLFEVPLPNYSGFTSQLKNVGKVENKGIEVTISTINTTGALQWKTDFNISANRNKVLELPGGNDIQYASGPSHLVGLGNSQILREGYPVGSFYGWVYEGVYQEGDTFIPGSTFEQVAGGEKFADINGEKDGDGDLTGNPDGILNADDRRIIGNPQPKFIFGFNNDFKYKNFDLNVFFQGSQGNDILSYTLLELETLGGSINSTKRALDRWTPENTDTNVPKRTAARPQRVSSRWVFDGSYIRLKNIALGYNVPSSVLQRLHVSRIRFYVSAQNIFTATKYRGFDPEVNFRSDANNSDSNRNVGLDYASYPNAKSYTFGLNIGL
jgi:TonB-linked SusC/RagA family outer membrane protein